MSTSTTNASIWSKIKVKTADVFLKNSKLKGKRPEKPRKTEKVTTKNTKVRISFVHSFFRSAGRIIFAIIGRLNPQNLHPKSHPRWQTRILGKVEVSIMVPEM